MIGQHVPVSLTKAQPEHHKSTHVMRTDLEIQKDILTQLQCEPFVNAAEIGVAVKNGIVMLSGEAANIAEKQAAGEAAWKAEGVRALVLSIRTGPSPAGRPADRELAEAVAAELEWHKAMHDRLIRIKVEAGVVTLEGEVNYRFQQEAAVDAIRKLISENRIENRITIRPPLSSEEAGKLLREALAIYPWIEKDLITVEMNGETVILTGAVYSAAERTQVESVSRVIPGASRVDNRLTLIKEQQPQKI